MGKISILVSLTNSFNVVSGLAGKRRQLSLH